LGKSGKSIGATLTLNNGNFFTNIKSAIAGTNQLKSAVTNATGSLKKMGGQGSAAGDVLGGMAKKVMGAAAAYIGFSQAKDFLTDCVTGVMELERANTRLGTLMMNVSGTTQTQIDDIISYGDALEQVTTIEGDATVAGASQLATFQLHADTIKTILPAFQDLAVAQYGVNVSQDQMIQSGNLIGKVMMGQTGALTKAGVTFTATQESILKTGTESQKAAALVEVLGANFGGLAQKMAQTPEGRIVQLKNAWGSVKDIVGYAVLPMITNVVNFMAAKIPAAQALVTNAVNAVKPPLLWIKDTILPPLISAFQNIWSFGVSAFNNIKTAVENNAPAFDSVKTVLLDIKDKLVIAFESAQPAIIWLKDVGLPAVVDVLSGVISGAADVYNFISSNWGAIAPIVGGIAAAVGAYSIAVGINNALVTYAAVVSGKKAAALAGLSIAELAHIAITGTATVVTTAFGAALAFVMSPVFLVVLAIGALVAVGILLWKNWSKVTAFFVWAWENIKSGAVLCWNAISGVFVSAAAWFNNTVVQPVWRVFGPIVTGIASIFMKVWEIITVLFGVLASWFNNTVIQPVIAFFMPIVTTIIGIFQSVWNGITFIFSAVGAWFGGVFTGAWNIIVSAFSGVAAFFTGVWDTITGIFTTIGTAIGNGIAGAFKFVVNSVISFAENTINGFIKAINWSIDVINKIPGVSITKLALIQVPKLAEGGILRSPGRVLVGERGPEFLDLPKGAQVTPLQKAGNNNTIIINIYADGKSSDEIVDEVVPKLKLVLQNL